LSHIVRFQGKIRLKASLVSLSLYFD